MNQVAEIQPIRQTSSDFAREQKVATYLQQVMPWSLTPTPKFYFTDYHINRLDGNEKENYIGDLEVKWLNTSSDKAAIFSYNKLQLMAAVPVYTDSLDSYHRICFRFTDGLLLLPALNLLPLKPVLFTRQDSQETDLIVQVQVCNFKNYFRPVEIN